MIVATVLVLASAEGERAGMNNAVALAAFAPIAAWILVAVFVIARRRRRRLAEDDGNKTGEDE